MSGWGFDFSQVPSLSLSGLGEKLQQLAADAESSIESQLRTERRITKPEGRQGDSTAEEQGGADGWGFEALGGLASAVLGTASSSRTGSPARRSPGSAQPSKEASVLPRPVPFWADDEAAVAGGAGLPSDADGSSSGARLPGVYPPPPQHAQQQQQQQGHREAKQHRLGAMRLGPGSPTSPVTEGTTRSASGQSLGSPPTPAVAAAAAGEEVGQPPLLGEELALSGAGAPAAMVARKPIGAVPAAAGAAVGRSAEAGAAVAAPPELSGAAVAQPTQDTGVVEPAVAPSATSTPGPGGQVAAARELGGPPVAGQVLLPPSEQQEPWHPQESSPGQLTAGVRALKADADVQKPQRLAAAESHFATSVDVTAAIAEAGPATHTSSSVAVRSGDEPAAIIEPIPAASIAEDEEQEGPARAPAQPAGLLLAVEAHTNGPQQQEQLQDEQHVAQQQQGGAAGQAQQFEGQPTVAAGREALMANGKAEPALAAVDATLGDYKAAAPSGSDREEGEGEQRPVQAQEEEQQQLIDSTEGGCHAAKVVSTETGGEQAVLAGKYSEPPVPAAVAAAEPATATRTASAASDQPAAHSDSGSSSDSHHGSGLEGEDLQLTVVRLREALVERERQIERKAQEVAQQQAAMDALVRKNEELVLQRASVSERDVEDMRRDFEQRLAASERKVYALTKERDALRRGSDKLSSMDDLVREKDSIIKQVMEEGEALSRKQLQQEQTIRKLRAQVKELQAQVTDLGAKLAAETSRADGASAERAAAAAELATLREAHAAELLSERQHFERQITEARAAQVAAENKALDAAKQGAAKKLRDSEARVDALEATVAELRDELERQRAAADAREDMLSAEVTELQRRCGEAEARQQEAAARLPEATAPLLRQVEAMQEEARSASLAWAEAERALAQRLRAAEEAAAAAKRAQASLAQQVEEAQEAAAQASEALREAQQQLQTAAAALESERLQRAAAETTACHLRSDLAAAQDSLRTLEQVYAQQMDAVQQREANAVSKLRALEYKQQQQDQGGPAADGPPALAAPGYKWVLLKDGERSPSNGGHPSAAAMAAGAGAGISRHASFASRASAVGSELEPGRPASPDGQGELLHKQGQAALRLGAAAAARKGSTPSLRHEMDEATGEEPEEDTTIRGLTLWGSGLSMRSMGASALPAPSGPDSHQLLTLKQAVRELEATRDRLSEELVKASTEAQQGSIAQQRVAALEAELTELRRRHDACLQLLGERQEQLEELREDLEEIRLNYRQQIDFMAEQMVQLQEQAQPQQQPQL